VVKTHSQKFGGPWSIIKLDTVQKYLAAYATLMRDKPTATRPFKRIYIDAFAGSGYFSFGEDDPATLLDEASGQEEHMGSALRALDIKPPFDQLWFIDKSATNIAALKQEIGADPRAVLRQGDANTVVGEICRNPKWKTARGVIFLDPFGTSVEWSTLEAIQRTEALDLWYLFPIYSLYRNAPRKREDLTPDKERTVTRQLGYDGWVDEFYAPVPASRQTSMFEESEDRLEQRDLNVAAMEAIVKRRLETIFPKVLGPGRLLGPSKAPLYSLFFAVSNPSPRAIEPASNIARDLLSQLAPGTRPKSSRPARGPS
jgi:three-Cys-motif partner protein